MKPKITIPTPTGDMTIRQLSVARSKDGRPVSVAAISAWLAACTPPEDIWAKQKQGPGGKKGDQNSMPNWDVGDNKPWTMADELLERLRRMI